MADNMTDYLENEVLDHTLGVGVAYSQPTTYLALFTADPTDTGALANEVANAGAYARVALAGAFGTAASGGSIANDADITFPTATASWGTVTHIGIMDGNTWGAGNMLYHAPLSVAKAIGVDDTFKITIGNLTVTLG